jgi:hypothetical protein
MNKQRIVDNVEVVVELAIEVFHDHIAIYFNMRMNSIPQGKEILLFCHPT